MYLQQRCFDGSVNKTILKPCLTAAGGRQYIYMGFSWHKIPRSSAYAISEKAIWFRHPNPCTHFWVILLTDRQIDRQTRAKTFTSSFVGGNNTEDRIRNLTSKRRSLFLFSIPTFLDACSHKHCEVLRSLNVFYVRSLTIYYSHLDLLRWCCQKTQSLPFFSLTC